MKNTLESLPTDTSKPTTCLEVNLLLNFSTYIWDHHEYLLLKEKKKKKRKKERHQSKCDIWVCCGFWYVSRLTPLKRLSWKISKSNELQLLISFKNWMRVNSRMTLTKHLKSRGLNDMIDSWNLKDQYKRYPIIEWLIINFTQKLSNLIWME